MGILFGRETRQAFPEPPIPAYYGAPVGGRSGGGLGRHADAALVVPTVWACVGLLANTVSMMQLETFYRATAGSVPRRAPDPLLVTSPAPDMTQSEWLHEVMVSLLLRGNGYAMKVARDAHNFGQPTQLPLLSPDKVNLSVDPATNATVIRLGNDLTDRSDEVWQIRGLTMPGTKVGLSPIAYAAATLGVDIHSREFASGFFKDGAHPSAILATTQTVGKEAANTIKERFLAAITGREPAVLGAGLTYTPIQINPEESQFLATQQANVAQIARFFWIPAEMVGGTGGSSMTYSNIEQRSLDFLTYAVTFWLKRIEDAISALLPANVYVKFNTSALLRVDAVAAATVDTIRIASKVLAPSEVRDSLELPPMTPEQLAEVALVPLAVGPTGAVKPLPPPPATAAPTDGGPDA